MSASEKRGRGRPKTVNRQRAIEVAMSSYWIDGVQSLSLNELCRRAQLSKPALYREFGNEDGLMEAALAHYYTLMLRPLLSALDHDTTLNRLVEGLLAAVTSDREGPAGCLFTEMRHARAHLGPTTLERLQHIERERRAALAAWYQRAQQRRAVSPDVTPELAGSYIDAQISTMLLQLGAGESAERVRAQARLAFLALAPPTQPPGNEQPPCSPIVDGEPDA